MESLLDVGDAGISLPSLLGNCDASDAVRK
jgi:hypothetical protein